MGLRRAERLKQNLAYRNRVPHNLDGASSHPSVHRGWLRASPSAEAAPQPADRSAAGPRRDLSLAASLDSLLVGRTSRSLRAGGRIKRRRDRRPSAAAEMAGPSGRLDRRPRKAAGRPAIGTARPVSCRSRRPKDAPSAAVARNRRNPLTTPKSRVRWRRAFAWKITSAMLKEELRRFFELPKLSQNPGLTRSGMLFIIYKFKKIAIEKTTINENEAKKQY